MASSTHLVKGGEEVRSEEVPGEHTDAPPALRLHLRPLLRNQRLQPGEVLEGVHIGDLEDPQPGSLLRRHPCDDCLDREGWMMMKALRQINECQMFRRIMLTNECFKGLEEECQQREDYRAHRQRQLCVRKVNSVWLLNH